MKKEKNFGNIKPRKGLFFLRLFNFMGGKAIFFFLLHIRAQNKKETKKKTPFTFIFLSPLCKQDKHRSAKAHNYEYEHNRI